MRRRPNQRGARRELPIASLRPAVSPPARDAALMAPRGGREGRERGQWGAKRSLPSQHCPGEDPPSSPYRVLLRMPPQSSMTSDRNRRRLRVFWRRRHRATTPPPRRGGAPPDVVAGAHTPLAEYVASPTSDSKATVFVKGGLRLVHRGAMSEEDGS